jgi:hypothetical protein
VDLIKPFHSGEMQQQRSNRVRLGVVEVIELRDGQPFHRPQNGASHPIQHRNQRSDLWRISFARPEDIRAGVDRFGSRGADGKKGCGRAEAADDCAGAP